MELEVKHGRGILFFGSSIGGVEIVKLNFVDSEIITVKGEIEKYQNTRDFTHLGHLQKLNLSSNFIVKHDWNAFNNSQGFKELNLSNNKIKHINMKIFRALVNLR